MKYKLLIVDDHLIFLESLSLLLDSMTEFEIVGTASNGKEALLKLQETEVDILLCDYMMPQMDGVELIFRMKEAFPNVKILMLTGNEDVNGIKKAIQMGVSGIIMKNTRKEELKKALLSVGEGATHYSPSVMQILSQNKSTEENQNETLSKRELEILKLIADSYTGIQISEKLHISYNTVETHRKNIFRKLGVNTSHALIKYVFENNLGTQPQ
jgi:two-component system, NarL family, nitrate/nitrite response regulator NarL